MRLPLVFLLLAMSGAAAAASAPTPLACGKVLSLAVPAAGVTLELVSTAPGPSWLGVRELGQDLEVDTSAAVQAAAPLPPRLGRWWLQLQPGEAVRLRRARPSPAAGTMRLQLDCDAAVDPARDWLLRATPFLQRTRKALP
ncbi:MAG: hypothetical protein F9K31_13790, partial [Dokdonella sp.]